MTQAVAVDNGKNYNGIDLLKFIGALLVFTGHFFEGEGLLEMEAYHYHAVFIAAIGESQVPFFFVAAGFFLFRKINIDNFDFKPVLIYLKKIFCFYIVWTLIYLPDYAYKTYKYHPKGYLHYILAYIRDFFFVGSAGHLWFLLSLMFAVSLISFLLYKRVKLSRILQIGALMYIAGLFLGQSLWFLAKPFIENSIFWKLYKLVFTTSNNCFFAGVVQVAIGADIAVNHKENRFTSAKLLVGLLCSLGLLYLEFFLVFRFDSSAVYNMYIFQVPMGIFIFYLGVNLRFNNDALGRHFRKLSTLVYFARPLLHTLFDGILRMSGFHFISNHMLVHYILLMAFIILVSEALIYLSSYKGFKWIRFFY